MKLGAGDPSGVVDSMSKEENRIHQKTGSHTLQSLSCRLTARFVCTFNRGERRDDFIQGEAYFEILARLAFL